MEKRERAKRIIDRYAGLHAGTAFVAGHLGGQFGFDRIPLTALTVSMITELCLLYEVRDTGAIVIHVGWAIGRLTLRGTAIAQTFLNWIPIAGPGANSGVTYGLTKQAVWNCANDTEKNRMNA